MSHHKGNSVNLHFQIMQYMLEGPKRTRRDIVREFDVARNCATVYIEQLIRLNLIRPAGKVGAVVNFEPVRALCPAVPTKPLMVCEPHIPTIYVHARGLSRQVAGVDYPL